MPKDEAAQKPKRAIFPSLKFIGRGGGGGGGGGGGEGGGGGKNFQSRLSEIVAWLNSVGNSGRGMDFVLHRGVVFSWRLSQLKEFLGCIKVLEAYLKQLLACIRGREEG